MPIDIVLTLLLMCIRIHVPSIQDFHAYSYDIFMSSLKEPHNCNATNRNFQGLVHVLCITVRIFRIFEQIGARVSDLLMI